jgi:capsid protein
MNQPDKIPTKHRLVSGPKASLPATRKQLLQQARFEIARNPDVFGMLQTLAALTISTGPVSDDDAFNEYAERISLPNLLYQSRIAKARDGEIFWLLVEKEGEIVPIPIESDQVTNYSLSAFDNNHDGIIVNEFGEPVEYQILEKHPESLLPSYNIITVPASNMLRYQNLTRTSQVRGITELQPALPYISLLSRLTEASVKSAEIVASLTGALKSDVVPGSEQLVAEPFEKIEIPHGGLLALPAGWELQTFPMANRSTDFVDIRTQLLKSIGRVFGLPAHLALGDSSNYNFSSAKLDHLLFRELVKRERKVIEKNLLNPLFFAVRFNRVINGQTAVPQFQWPNAEIIDMETEINVVEKAINLGLTTVEQERKRFQNSR